MGRGHFELFLGIIFLVIANIMVFILSYDRFYTFLLIGLLLLFKGVYSLKNGKALLDFRMACYAYIIFFIFGIVGDLILGIILTDLWSYPTYSFVNYLNLYFVIYPLGGFVMLYSFVFFEELFIGKAGNLKKNGLISKIPEVLMLFSIIGFILYNSLFNALLEFFAYVFIGLFILGLFLFYSQDRNGSLLYKFASHPTKYSLLIIAVSYLQGIVHEYPNVFVSEWLYHSGFPLFEVKFMGMPVSVLFLGWPYLLLVVLAMYDSASAYYNK